MGKILSLLLVSFILIAGCSFYIPKEEMMMAETALKGAKEAQADTLAPTYFQQANETFRLAQRAFQEREYDLAQRLALKAKRLAEQAENKAVLKKEGGE